MNTNPDLPPQTPADIPGLGPIRVRALHKAGLDTLEALRAASFDTLLAVPGMSAIKAAHIQEFLARFPAAPPEPVLDVAPATADRKARKGKVKAEGSAQAAPDSRPAPVPLPEPTPPVQAAAVQTLGRTITLLLSVHAPTFRSRLLKELARFARHAASLASDKSRLSEKEQENLARRLRRIGDEFAAAAAQPDLDRKAQTRLIETLAEFCDRFAASGNEVAGGKSDA
jgi:hypothetical protein